MSSLPICFHKRRKVEVTGTPTPAWQRRSFNARRLRGSNPVLGRSTASCQFWTIAQIRVASPPLAGARRNRDGMISKTLQAGPSPPFRRGSFRLASVPLGMRPTRVVPAGYRTALLPRPRPRYRYQQEAQRCRMPAVRGRTTLHDARCATLHDARCTTLQVPAGRRCIQSVQRCMMPEVQRCIMPYVQRC